MFTLKNDYELFQKGKISEENFLLIIDDYIIEAKRTLNYLKSTDLKGLLIDKFTLSKISIYKLFKKNMNIFGDIDNPYLYITENMDNEDFIKKMNNLI